MAFDIAREIDRLDQLRCLNQANASPIIQQLDRQALDIANWRTTGYYEPDDIDRVIAATYKAVAAAKTALILAPPSTADASSVKAMRLSDLDSRIASGQMYLKASNAARNEGKVVDAAGFKKWLINAVNDISAAYTAVAVYNCRVTWLETALGFIKAIGDACRAIVGAAIDLAKGAIKAVSWWWEYRKLFLWGGAIVALGILAVPRIRRVKAYLNPGKE